MSLIDRSQQCAYCQADRPDRCLTPTPEGVACAYNRDITPCGWWRTCTHGGACERAREGAAA